jgi:hypothetical protein
MRWKRATPADGQRRRNCEPLYDIEPHTGATIEVFYADRVLAASFGKRGAGWVWWTCWRGGRPREPAGPFSSKYRAYRDAFTGCGGLSGRQQSAPFTSNR